MTISVDSSFVDQSQLVNKLKNDPNAYGRLQKVLMEAEAPISDRFRAIFTLKSLGTVEAVNILAEGIHWNLLLLRKHIWYNYRFQW